MRRWFNPVLALAVGGLAAAAAAVPLAPWAAFVIGLGLTLLVAAAATRRPEARPPTMPEPHLAPPTRMRCPRGSGAR
jgi:hypothetical protein